MAETADAALLIQDFAAEQITTLRHAVARLAGGVGLRGQRLDDFVLAVNEIVTNAVRHAGGVGRLRLWVQDGTVRCTVSDRGAGLPREWLDGPPAQPSRFSVGGRGLWLARHLCDALTVRSGSAGTSITLVSAIDRLAG